MGQANMNHVKIAVIGIGPAGLTALKALREEGFDAVGFERRDRVGGLWSFNPDTSYTSVLEGTVSNISKFVSGFSDFPIPDDYPAYLSGAEVAKYFRAYAKHFDLEKHVRFNTSVTAVLRHEHDGGWNVHITGPDGDTSVLFFDKVVFGTGSESVAKWPSMPGKEKFKGMILHGQSYRNPEQFRGKRVLVVGIGNTACEVSLSLTKHASGVYQAYRRGRMIVSRYLDDGTPTDSTIPWPMLRLKYLLDDKVPWLVNPLVDKFMVRKMIADASREDPSDGRLSRRERRRLAKRKATKEWRLTPCPSMAHENPAVQEHFLPALLSGEITPVRGFKDFVGSDKVLLDGGSIVEVDAVIFCTGYTLDWSIMPELDMDGACDMASTTAGEVEEQRRARARDEDPAAPPKGKEQPHLPRLYQLVFPPRYASSVAFLSCLSPQESVWCVCELASVAIGQIWAAETARDMPLEQPPAGYRKPALLPSVEEMNDQVDQYHAWWRKQWRQDSSVRQGLVRSYPFYKFMHSMAGTGMYDNLDHPFTGRGWSLRWKDKDVYRWMSKGPMNGYAWRLFDTNPRRIPGCGRKAWPGAREAMHEAYETFQSYRSNMKDEERRRKVLFEDDAKGTSVLTVAAVEKGEGGLERQPSVHIPPP
ncbi:Flavin monooxygenase-like protein [Drechmeria coniospora]|uniref:Flavin monooxygenase-like protein n=1 Tax=Drechmeria coniospora TaxID=98403 RepID=A0A151GJ53_DRECN|nr:Flavin monooxygenase-like protein [Drechmeria coniospora]KYK57116.1 Flavin monooxygenase-like protein [Drechmeria coniospora]ODA79023.1 hypothetical protein RJ55_04613 [Drechmeria coniospora]